MGTDIIVQLALMSGVRLGAVSEVRTELAIDAILMSGRDRADITQASSAQAIDAAIEGNRIAVADSTTSPAHW